MKVSIATCLIRLARSTVARGIVLVLSFVAWGIWVQDRPEMKTTHFEQRIELPAQYTLVELGVADDVDSFIEKTYGEDVLVEEVVSLDVYRQLFSEGHEHTAFIGQTCMGLATMDRGVVWVHKTCCWLDNRTLSVADNALIESWKFEPWISTYVCGYAILPLLSWIAFLAIVEFFLRLPPLICEI